VTASSKSSDPANQAAEISRMKGRVVIVGLVGMALDREPFYKRELDLRLSMSYGPGRYDPAYEQEGHDYPLPFVRWTEQRNMQAFLELIAEGKVTPAKLVTHRFPIAEAEAAYKLMESDEPYLAILLTYGGDAAVTRKVAVKADAKSSAQGSGFIGFGNYAKSVLLPALRKAGETRLTGVVTATGLSARNAAEKSGFATAATDPAELLRDDGTDCVFIATRHDSHARLAIDALKAGKHVFVEKPLALSHAELALVREAAETSPGILTVGFNRRFAPMIIKAREALAAQGGVCNLTYRINAGHIPGDSWVHASEGGGRIVGEACHFVDTLSFLAGSLPVSVQAIRPHGVEDSVAALISFANGSTGTILYSSLGDTAIPKESIEGFATGLVIQIDDFRRLAITRGGRTSETKSSAQDKGQAGLLEAFLKAARKGAPAPMSLDELCAVSAATLKMGGIHE
jgi:predicted dehydrogenase